MIVAQIGRTFTVPARAFPSCGSYVHRRPKRRRRADSDNVCTVGDRLSCGLLPEFATGLATQGAATAQAGCRVPGI